MSHSVSLFFKVIFYENEYYIVVSVSGASDARIYQINASKAEYMTMMVNSLSHEIITPVSEILKHCDLAKMKHVSSQKINSRLHLTGGLSGLGASVSSPDFKNSPGFTFGSQYRVSTPFGAGLHPGSSRALGMDQKSFGLTMVNAIGESRPITQGEDATPFTPFSMLTKQSHPNDTSIKPRSSARSSSPRVRVAEYNEATQSRLRESAYQINTSHLDIPEEAKFVGTCGLLAITRQSFNKASEKYQHQEPKVARESSQVAPTSQLLVYPNSLEMKQIKRIANRIHMFVDGLMGYSQILTQRFEPQVSPSYKVADLLREVADLFEEKCVYKGISIRVSCPPKLELTTDRKKLSSIFLIFLDNGVKFMNQKGMITISATVEPNKMQHLLDQPSRASANQQTFFKKFTVIPEEGLRPKPVEPELDDQDLVVFRIEDQGMGINKKDMEIIKYTLSNPFNTSPTSSSAGLGIGLRIAQAIISELSYGQGKLEIQSQIGSGTAIIFEMPCEAEIRPDEIDISINEGPVKKSETIFNEANRSPVLGPSIQKADEPASADRPQAKLQSGVLRTHSDSVASGLRPTVNSIPKLQLEFTKSLFFLFKVAIFKKSFSKTRTLATPMAGLRTPNDLIAEPKVIQMHSPSFGDLASSFNRKSLPAHMASNTPNGQLIDDSQMLQKPGKLAAERARYSLRMDSIRNSKTIRTPDFQKASNTRDSSKFIRYQTQGVGASLTSLFGQTETKKVMIVDDEVFLLEFLREILESLGLEVYTANSPERAFELSTSLGNMSKKINLVYMDYNMPNMNGAECTRILKSDAHRRAMDGAWFTVQTAQNDKFVRDQFKAVGVTDFLSKPYSFDQIVQHLQSRQLLDES